MMTPLLEPNRTQNPPIVVGLGELLWDVFDDQRRPGGAPANVAYIAQQLGLRGTVCSRVGLDEWGQKLLEFLQQNHLDTEFVQQDLKYPTSWVTVDLSRPEDPQYTIHGNVAWEHLVFDSKTETLMQHAAAICFGTLAQRGATARKSIYRSLEATRSNCLRVYDVNLRRPWYEKSWIEHSLQLANIVKLNLDEVVQLTEMFNLKATDPHSFATELQPLFDIDLICITRGADGCMLVDRSGVTEQAGISISVADPVGAGDAFTAALIYTQLHGWPRDRSAQFANRAAALVASQPGAMPEIKQELAALIEELG